MRLIVLLIGSAIIAGCARVGEADSTSHSTGTPPPAFQSTKSSAGDEAEAVIVLGRLGEPLGEDYEEHVEEAASTDLTERLGIGPEEAVVVSAGRIEVPVASPCGEGGGGREPGGLSLGYEVLLESDSTRHRYVAVGALLHYCGASDPTG